MTKAIGGRACLFFGGFLFGEFEASLGEIGAALAVEVTTEEFDLLALGVWILGSLEKTQLDEASRRFREVLRRGGRILGDFFGFVGRFGKFGLAVLFAIAIAEAVKDGRLVFT